VAGCVGPHAPVCSAETGRRQLRYEGQVPAAVGPAAHATAHPQGHMEGDRRRRRGPIEPAHPEVRRRQSSRAQKGKGKANSPARRGRRGDECGEGAGYSSKRETPQNCASYSSQSSELANIVSTPTGSQQMSNHDCDRIAKHNFARVEGQYCSVSAVPRPKRPLRPYTSKSSKLNLVRGELAGLPQRATPDLLQSSKERLNASIIMTT
jgi:hypothetical protein